MENWGLITGRTSVYLYDSKKSGIASKKRVIGVQSHEVSHQLSFWVTLFVSFGERGRGLGVIFFLRRKLIVWGEMQVVWKYRYYGMVG